MKKPSRLNSCAGIAQDERTIVAGIKKARAELRAGKGIPHDEAMKMMALAIAQAAERGKNKQHSKNKKRSGR